MVELPLLENGDKHTICVSCPALTLREGKNLCDQSRLTANKRPFLCPLPKQSSAATTSAYELLKRQLRG